MVTEISPQMVALTGLVRVSHLSAGTVRREAVALKSRLWDHLSVNPQRCERLTRPPENTDNLTVPIGGGMERDDIADAIL